VLLNAATAYMNLIRDAAILHLQRSNVEVLQEQLRQTRDRFNAGEVTRTDVAQSESRLASARATMLTAESNYVTSRSTYRQVIGVEPGTLAPASPVDACRRESLQAAVERSAGPASVVTTAMFNVDAAVFQVKIAESSLYPRPQCGRQRPADLRLDDALTSVQSFAGSVLGQLTIPVYQGGTEYATIRQAKETLGQRRIDLDTARDQSQQTLTQILGQLEAAKAQIQATTTQVNAAEIALNGVREEAASASAPPRRAQRPAGTRQRPRFAGHRPARPGGGVVFVAGGGGTAVAEVLALEYQSTTRRCTTIRCATPGSACARPTENNCRFSGRTRRDMCVSTGLRLRSRIAVPYLQRSE
jgi:hypothetical protein